MTSDQVVVAQFDVGGRLTVTKSGSGNGIVSSSPTGIDCGGICSFVFARGTIVTLTATTNGKNTFAGWSGAGCAGTGTCIVVIGSDQTTVNAEFE